MRLVVELAGEGDMVPLGDGSGRHGWSAKREPLLWVWREERAGQEDQEIPDRAGH